MIGKKRKEAVVCTVVIFIFFFFLHVAVGGSTCSTCSVSHRSLAMKLLAQMSPRTEKEDATSFVE